MGKNIFTIKKFISKSWDERRENNSPQVLNKNTSILHSSSYSSCDNYSLIPKPINKVTIYPSIQYFNKNNEIILEQYIKSNKYDPINNCKSAGIIPYTLINSNVYFLLQYAYNPVKKKDIGWNDFGGKRTSSSASTAETAAREFSEETSCLFYFKYHNSAEANINYNLLKDNKNLLYDTDTIEILKKSIPMSQMFFMEKITEFAVPIYVSSKETYISYFVYVPHIPENEIPRAEDIHIPYEQRYLRKCKWFSYTEILMLNERDFHKRLQITKIQHRIKNYYKKGLFT